jgi:hypothetical protein
MKYQLQSVTWSRVMNNIQYALMNLDKQKNWLVEIKEKKDSRSLEQNNKFHAMCQELGDAIGYTAEEMKRLAKHELGFYTVVNGPVGKIARLDSSADWDTEKMSRAIEQLNIWAIEVGHIWRIEHD